MYLGYKKRRKDVLMLMTTHIRVKEMWTKPSFLDLQNTKLCFPEAMRDRIPNAYATMSTNESFSTS